MPVSAQYYITCSGCGVVAKESIGNQMLNLYGETELEVREEACELGWWTNANDGTCSEGRESDFCPTCVAEKKHQPQQ